MLGYFKKLLKTTKTGGNFLYIYGEKSVDSGIIQGYHYTVQIICKGADMCADVK